LTWDVDDSSSTIVDVAAIAADGEREAVVVDGAGGR
jgi:hypothetical protein